MTPPTPPSGSPPPRAQPHRDGPLAAELIAVGRDLLHGRTQDQNSHHLAASLSDRGARVRRVTVVDDQPDGIAAAVREALERGAGLIVVFGGLGPGYDDRTHDGVAAGLSRPTVPSEPARRHVEETFQRLAKGGRVTVTGMTLTREKLARLPLAAEALLNPKGVAIGSICRIPGGTAVVTLPGRPSELRATWDLAIEALSDVLPRRVAVVREVEAPTADESELREILELLEREHPQVWLTTHPANSPRGNARALVALEAVAEDGPQATTLVESALGRLLQLASTSREMRRDLDGDRRTRPSRD